MQEDRKKDLIIKFLEWMNATTQESPMALETDNDDIAEMFLSSSPLIAEPIKKDKEKIKKAIFEIVVNSHFAAYAKTEQLTELFLSQFSSSQAQTEVTQQQKQEAISFAEWIMKNRYERGSGDRWLSAGISSLATYYTAAELYSLFVQSNKTEK